ncbi:MAG TPA: undecaprenyldiphospho-muramoylpentapeptide beta-N-acetylglucosaminyltransferase [Stellaceae bacterium]|nr:undecaprenyldiphospho-muramoylpentapeptide beta-N-acetylglucosaminyltransferase [Stellaceae bacterium]
MTALPLVVLAAGGTGGHMFPAEALARELVGRGHGVALVTDARGQVWGDRMAGVATYRIRAGRFGRGLLGNLKGIVDIARGTLEAGRLLRRLGPGTAVGFGGYPSVPTMLAAARLRVPTMIHDQNAVLGRANRLLAGRVRAIATAFDTVQGLKPADRGKIVRTGNPVRPAIAALRDQPYAAPEPDGEIRLLVTGGSQGARILSQVIPAALKALPEALRRRLNVSQQVRPEDLATVEAAYRDSGIIVDLKAFFDDIPARLGAAHLVIARAGGSTVAELTVAGRPAVLVPLASALADEQTANAQILVERGGAWLLAEKDFASAALAELLERVLGDSALLDRSAAAAHSLGEPAAASLLADLVATLQRGVPS